MSTNDVQEIYCHGAFELDARRFELRHAGRPVAVAPRVLETILYLARHPDRMVTKRELADEVWGQRVVTDEVVRQTIKSARRALDDRRGHLIVTVRGRGFRFSPSARGDGAAAPPERVSPRVGATASDAGWTDRSRSP